MVLSITSKTPQRGEKTNRCRDHVPESPALQHHDAQPRYLQRRLPPGIALQAIAGKSVKNRSDQKLLSEYSIGIECPNVWLLVSKVKI